MTDQNSVTLITLGDQGNTIADPTQDIRGRTVVDADGTKIGRIADLLVDLQEQKVRFLRVEHGGILGFGASATFIPVDAVNEIRSDSVRITHRGAQVAASPVYDPQLAEVNDYYAGLYDYYGYAPFWGPIGTGGRLGPGR